jgi:hypothetical protein
MFSYIIFLFNKWADQGEKNINNLFPQTFGKYNEN